MLPNRLKGYSKDNEFASRGKYQHKDYAKNIKWSPLKITVATLCIILPYLVVVIAIASTISIGAAMPLIVIPLVLAALLGLVYGIGLLGRARPRRQKHPKRQ